MMFFFENGANFIFKKFKERRSSVSGFQGFEMLFLPIEIIFDSDFFCFLMRFFRMFYGNIQQLNSVGTVDISSVAIGLLLEIIFHFKYNSFRLSHRNTMTNRREIGRMDYCILHLVAGFRFQV